MKFSLLNFRSYFLGPLTRRKKKGFDLGKTWEKWGSANYFEMRNPLNVSLVESSRAWKSSLWAPNYMLGNLIPAMTKEFPNVSLFIMKFASLFLGIRQWIFPSGSKISPFTPEDLLSDGDSLNWKWAWFGIKWGDIKKSNTMNKFSGPKSESRLSSSPVPRDTTGLKR